MQAERANKAPFLTPPPDMPWLLEKLARSSEEAEHSDARGVILSPSPFFLSLFQSWRMKDKNLMIKKAKYFFKSVYKININLILNSHSVLHTIFHELESC